MGLGRSRQWVLLFVLLACTLTISAQEDVPIRAFGSSLAEGEIPEARLASRSKTGEESTRIETRLVLNDVMVLDKKGQMVSGLLREDFKVFEDGREQEIIAVTPATDVMFGKAIVLIVDYSESVLPYVESSLEAAKTLVDKLEPTDKMAIVTDDVELLSDFTSDKNLLNSKLDDLKDRVQSGTMGKSRQYSALMATLTELLNDTKFRPIVILQSDGDEYMRLKGSDATGDDVRYTFRDVLETTERVGATVYTVIPGPIYEKLPRKEQYELARAELSVYNLHRVPIGRTYLDPKKISNSYLKLWSSMRRRDHGAISKLAIKSGGSVENLGELESAGEVYSRILNSVSSRYVIGYYPEDQTFNGSRRTVTVKVLNHRDYTVYGRKSYRAW